jgi:hypothetical protein
MNGAALLSLKATTNFREALVFFSDFRGKSTERGKTRTFFSLYPHKKTRNTMPLADVTNTYQQHRASSGGANSRNNNNNAVVAAQKGAMSTTTTTTTATKLTDMFGKKNVVSSSSSAAASSSSKKTDEEEDFFASCCAKDEAVVRKGTPLCFTRLLLLSCLLWSR